MKKILSILILSTLFITFIPVSAFADEQGYFVVTAYYSPLPDQKYYLKGNYNDEIRLNGKGIAGASGKNVFSGMLAAPKNYKFGTKIQLEGLGIGSVEDRGGAIVNAGNRGYSSDRIDVWMGYGDEGLRRALYWGKRKVKGNIISNNTQTTLNYNNIPAPSWVVSSLEQTPNIFYKSIGKYSEKNDIYDLKLFLQDNNFYNGIVDYEYSNDLISSIHEFQLGNNIISKDEILGAGYWGEKTRTKFLEEYRLGKLESNYNKNTSLEYDKNNILNKNQDIDENIISSNNYNNIILKGDINYIFNNPVKSIAHIAELQNILIELELFDGEVDGKYESIKDIILEYQLNNEIITNENNLGAGYYGPKTRELLYQDYIEYIEYKEKIIKTELLIQGLKETSLKKAEEKLDSLGNLSFGNISPEVRDLQLILKHFGYFSDNDTAIFGNVTKQAIISMQIDREVIVSETSIGSGIYGPSTKQELIILLSEYYFQEKFNELELDEELLSELKKSSTIL